MILNPASFSRSVSLGERLDGGIKRVFPVSCLLKAEYTTLLWSSAVYFGAGWWSGEGVLTPRCDALVLNPTVHSLAAEATLSQRLLWIKVLNDETQLSGTVSLIRRLQSQRQVSSTTLEGF